MTCNYKNKFNKCNPGCNEECLNDCSECSKYQQLAHEKCEQANCMINKASRVAQQAKQAEQRADCLKQQALEECARANCLWEEYRRLAKQGECLMNEAKNCMEASVKCYKDCYKDDFGCNMADYGYKPCLNENHGCNHECKHECNHDCNHVNKCSNNDNCEC